MDLVKIWTAYKVFCFFKRLRFQFHLLFTYLFREHSGEEQTEGEREAQAAPLPHSMESLMPGSIPQPWVWFSITGGGVSKPMIMT